jgi:hypothetical protein
MLGFRITPPGPYWLEDLAYAVVDRVRLVAARGRAAWEVRAAVAAKAGHAVDRLVARFGMARHEPPPPAARAEPISVAPLLDEPEAWALATEPLSAADTGASRAAAMHRTAAEQLDALTYVLDRVRQEVRPFMTYARLAGEPVHAMPETAALEAGIEALLELSRQNAATRPKRYAESAA